MQNGAQQVQNQYAYVEHLLGTFGNVVPNLRQLVLKCQEVAPTEPVEPQKFSTEENPDETRRFLEFQSAAERTTQSTVVSDVYKQTERAKDPHLNRALQDLLIWLQSDQTGRAGIHEKFFGFTSILQAAQNHWASSGAEVNLSPTFEDNLDAAEPTADFGPLAVSGGFDNMKILRDWYTEITMNKALLEANYNGLVKELATQTRSWSNSENEVVRVCADAENNLQSVIRACATTYEAQMGEYHRLQLIARGKQDRRIGLVGEMVRDIEQIELLLDSVLSKARQYKELGREITEDSVKHDQESQRERAVREQELQNARNANAFMAKVREGKAKGSAVLAQVQAAYERTFRPPLRTVDDALSRVKARHDQCYKCVETALNKQQTDLPPMLEGYKHKLATAQAQVAGHRAAYEQHKSWQTDEEFKLNEEVYVTQEGTAKRFVTMTENKIRENAENIQKLQHDFALFTQGVGQPGAQAAGAAVPPAVFPPPTTNPQQAHTVSFQPQFAQPPSVRTSNSQGFQPAQGLAPAATPPWATNTTPMPNQMGNQGNFGQFGGHPGFNQQGAPHNAQPNGFPQPPPPGWGAPNAQPNPNPNQTSGSPQNQNPAQ